MRDACIHRAARGFGLLMTVLLLGACAHIGKDQYETDMADLRRMIAEGDEANAERSEDLEARLAEESRRMDDLEGQLRILASDFRELGATIERMEAAIRVHVPVYFGFDDATLRNADRPMLERFSGVMAEYYPGAMVTVEGFTDPAGSAEYNLKLGQARADAVRDFLLEQGMVPEHVRAVSYGEDTSRLLQPGDHGPGQPGWQNRRVVLVIDGSAPDMDRAIITPSS